MVVQYVPHQFPCYQKVLHSNYNPLQARGYHMLESSPSWRFNTAWVGQEMSNATGWKVKDQGATKITTVFLCREVMDAMWLCINTLQILGLLQNE